MSENRNSSSDSFTQFFISIFEKSRFGKGILIALCIVIGLTYIFSILPEKRKEQLIDKIVEPEKSQIQNSTNANDDTIKRISSPIPKSESPKRYVKIKLIVNAQYSRSRIFANGKEISPYEDNTIIKLLEIEYKNHNIELTIQSLDNNKCVKNISIPKNYFQTPKFIEVICSN